MLDFRVKKPTEAINWRYQEIIVTDDYLTNNANDLNLITLDSPYEVGKKVLDVFLNGDRLTDDIGYVEVDDLHIRLDSQYRLQVGDEIVIKEWFNSDSILYSTSGINNRLTAVEIEVRKARNYDDATIVFPDLRSRLNFMQDELDQLKFSSPAIDDLTVRVETIEAELGTARDTYHSLDDRLDYIQDLAEQGGGGIGNGDIGLTAYSTSVVYTTDDYGNVLREDVTGDIEFVKEYSYDSDDNLVEEKTTAGTNTYVRSYHYNSDGFLVGEDGHKLEFVSSLTSKALRDVGYLLGEGTYDVEFTYNVDGKVEKETVTGDYNVTKDYTYNAQGDIHTETMTYGKSIITKTYRYDVSSGRVSGFSCTTVTT